MSYEFETVALDALERLDATSLDALPFGVIGLRPDTTADIYNATEAKFSGVAPETVLGKTFFENIGQCMNNFMVAQRFEDEPQLNAIVPFVLTLRMRPTRVRLRLLKEPDTDLRYILIDRP